MSMKLSEFVCLLRGVNVGSSNRIGMSEVRKLMEKLDFSRIQTYIQSGNIIFSTCIQCKSTLSTMIYNELLLHGVSAPVTILTCQELQDIADSNPYPNAVSEPKSLHVYLLASEPDHRDMQELSTLCSKSEEVRLRNSGDVYYLFVHAPEGIGKSKLISKMERVLNMSATGRNWRTIQRLLLMISGEYKIPNG